MRREWGLLSPKSSLVASLMIWIEILMELPILHEILRRIMQRAGIKQKTASIVVRFYNNLRGKDGEDLEAHRRRILDIVAGILSLIGSLVAIVGMIAVGSSPEFWRVATEVSPARIGLAETALIVIAIVAAISGVLTLLGGIYAVQRKKWVLALVGSVVGILSATLLGVLATVFIAISKEEFQ